MKEKSYVLRLSPDQHSALYAYLSGLSASREQQVKFYQEHAQENPDVADRCRKMIDILSAVDSIRDELWNLL
jgi:hypothetical protein